ncbi:hypothetical protein MFLAVUS_010310 [Mucor flavus]|uniref:SWIM-type domain-containing protein n=1 Tax=Mucor flavus TaxID=439312 RepID=A0ABP9ZCE9_9FUNG
MNQSVNTYSINTYQPMPKFLEVPVTEYQAVIEGSIAKYGIKWVYSRKIVSNSNEEETLSATSALLLSTGRDSSRTLGIWITIAIAMTNLSGKQRVLQKASKKSSCPTRLKVTCFKKNLRTVTLEIASLNFSFILRSFTLTTKNIQWCAAFQPQIYKPDLIANTNIIQLSVGRTGPEERRRRRRELNAEAINEELLPLLIEQAEDSQNGNEVIYKVKSFTTDDIIYNIIVVEDKMKACGCLDFTWNNIACEHMYFLRRYNRNIAVFIISINLPTTEVFTDNIRTEQQQQKTIEI